MAVPCSACHVRRALSITREKRVSRKLVAHSRVHREKLEIFQTCWPTARDIEGLPIASLYGFMVYHDYLRLKVFVCVCVGIGIEKCIIIIITWNFKEGWNGNVEKYT